MGKNRRAAKAKEKAKAADSKKRITPIPVFKGDLNATPNFSENMVKHPVVKASTPPSYAQSDSTSEVEGESSASPKAIPFEEANTFPAHQVFEKIPEPNLVDAKLAAHQVFEEITEPRQVDAKLATPSGLPNTTSKGPSWSNIVSNNSRNVGDGIKLSKVEVVGDEFVLDPTHLVDVNEAWGHCFVGFFASNFPGLGAFRAMCNGWGVPYRYFRHASGWIVFKFTTDEDRDKVLLGGPYYVYGRPLITKSIPPCFEMDEADDLNFVPVWIKLPGLPVDLWSESLLSQIVSRVGNPIATDSFTKSRERVSFARVLVEVDASKELVQSINLRLLKDKVRVQKVEYEFLPKFCSKCKKLGHSSEGCDAHTAAGLAREALRQRGMKQQPTPKASSSHLKAAGKNQANKSFGPKAGPSRPIAATALATKSALVPAAQVSILEPKCNASSRDGKEPVPLSDSDSDSEREKDERPFTKVVNHKNKREAKGEQRIEPLALDPKNTKAKYQDKGGNSTLPLSS